MLSESNSGEFDKVNLLDKDFFIYLITDEINEFKWEDLAIEEHKISEDVTSYLYLFPLPKGGAEARINLLEAKYGIIFFDDANARSKYFTLEQSFTPNNEIKSIFIGSMSADGTHSNLGTYRGELTKESFLKYAYLEFMK